MINDINKYIDFLKTNFNLSIFVHSEDPSFAEFTNNVPYSIHLNPYCLFVKSSREMWHKCLFMQQQIPEKISNGCELCTCFAGVSEYIFPIRLENEYVGFLSVTGYIGNKNDYLNFAKKSGFNYNDVKKYANKNLLADIPPKEKVTILIKPLISMILLFIIATKKKTNANGMDNIFINALTYIHSNYTDKIKVKDISNTCFISESYLNRVFKKHSGKSVIEYINDYRIEKAKQLLENTNMQINDIAFCIGFLDSNYFISKFKKLTNTTPKQYRKQKRQIIN